ncbi:MAG: hypothetical protein RLY86_3228 [Pseudomonadota bacterium]|jgi:hypothetical protein
MAAPAQALSARTVPGAELAPVDLGGRCEIIPGSPLPDYNGPAGQAHVARSLRERKTDMYAVVLTGEVPARIETLPTYRGMEHPNLLRTVDWGAVEWTPEQRRRFTIVFERPGGRRLMDSLDDMRDPLPDDMLVRGFLPSMLSVLRDMNMRGITAGGMRPTNLFFRDTSASTIVLGDCVSAPAGYGQPVLVETIDRGMAQPSGRGNGTIGDDLYALGVTLLVLAMGRNPLRDLDDDAIVRVKMDKGSYPALTAGLRIPQSLVEPLRGLTTDDPKQRWSLSDLDMWLQGRRLSPKQPQIPKRGARPLEIGGEEAWHCRSVARALSRNSALAAPMIERGDLDKWLRRSLNDEQRADQVQDAIDSAGAAGRGASQEDRTVARVAIALDGPAPIRYRGTAVMPDGVGTALAEAFARDGAVQPLAELVLSQLPMFWVSCQPDFRPEHVPLVQTFDLQRTLLEHTGPGFGIERVLYELCPASPCLSPLIRDRYALTMGDMMAALDQVAGQATKGRDPMDRHIAAFIATHNKKMSDRLFSPLAGQTEPAKRIIATMVILADVQNRFGPARLPKLCDWLVQQMDPAFKRFRNRHTREKLLHEAERVARDGVIDALVRLVDNADSLRRDESGFVQATRRYEGLTTRIDMLRQRIKLKGEGPSAKGRQWAAIISNAAAMIGLIGIVIMMARG